MPEVQFVVRAMDQKPSAHLVDLFFPVQEVAALPTYDVAGDRAGTQLHFDHALEKLPKAEGQKPTFAIRVKVESKDAESVNAPYHFVIEAYGIVRMDSSVGDDAADSSAATVLGLQVVIGAIRERLADLTSRAPWGRFLMNVVMLSDKVAVTSASADSGEK